MSGRGGKGNMSRRNTEDLSLNVQNLPAPIWGHVLDYLPYNEVRSALLIGKSFANEVVKYVQTLNIFKGGELCVPAARRFPNVTEANILCLLTNMRADGEVSYYLDEDDEDQGETRFGCTYDLNQEAMWKIVPFLSCHSKLERFVLGGYRYRDGDNDNLTIHYIPSTRDCKAPSNHVTIFSSFVDSFIGAMESGLLSVSSLKATKGLLNDTVPICQAKPIDPHGSATNNSCGRCISLCKHLPFHDIVTGHYKLCLSRIDCFRLIQARSGGKEYVQSKSEHLFLPFICEGMVKEFLRAPPIDGNLYFIRESQLAIIDALIDEFGLRPGDVKKEDLLKYVFRPDYIHLGNPEFMRLMQGYLGKWIKSSVDALIKRGFDLEGIEEHITLVDDGDPKLHWIKEFMTMIEDDDDDGDE